MVQWVKLLATKPEDLNSVPWKPQVNLFPTSCLLNSTHMPWDTHTCTYTKCIKIFVMSLTKYAQSLVVCASFDGNME